MAFTSSLFYKIFAAGERFPSLFYIFSGFLFMSDSDEVISLVRMSGAGMEEQVGARIAVLTDFGLSRSSSVRGFCT